MPSTFQRQSRLRKIIYVGLILFLLTFTLLWRGMIVEAQAERLHLREQDLGQIELTGKTVQLVSTGLRGLAVTGLWMGVIEEQKRHEWPEMKLLVDSLTTLQPHLIRPWLFQSWNLAYNVSVISDQSADQYFYVTEGMDLLARGERQNVDDPDIRFTMGHMYQNKLGQGDKRREFRALFDMSCLDLHTELNLDPHTRKSLRLRDGKKVNLTEFAKFSEKHPQLVRRIRQIRGHETPEDVVDFLESNAKVPSRYEYVSGAPPDKPSPLKPPEKRFPILPPEDALKNMTNPPEGETTELSLFDNFAAARAWYRHAQTPLPPPNTLLESTLAPRYDRRQYRIPRYMRTILFRAYPAHAQTYLAKFLEQEGWFDGDGWTLSDPDGFPVLQESESTRGLQVGTGRNWAQDAWRWTHEMWIEHGTKNGIYIEPKELEDLREKAGMYRRLFELDPDRDAPRPLTGDQPKALEDSYLAYVRLYLYRDNRHLTNYAHFHTESLVEQDPHTIKVRKHLDRAKRLQELGKNPEALAEYVRPKDKDLEKYPEPRTIKAWKAILRKNPDYIRDPSLTTQEESHRFQISYLRVALPENVKPLAPLLHGMAQATRQPPAGSDPLLAAVLALHSQVQAKRAADKEPPRQFDWMPLKLTVDVRRMITVQGPFDYLDADDLRNGTSWPLITDEARMRVQHFLPAQQLGSPARPPAPMTQQLPGR
jgi:hypothetical protein